MNIRQALILYRKNLNQKNQTSEASEALSFILNKDMTYLYTHFNDELKNSEEKKFLKCLESRKKNVPLSYITSEKFFYENNFYVTKEVLIPRAETELLVDWVLKKLENRKNEKLNFLDLGSGSSCIGISLLKKLKKARCLCLDISQKCLDIGKKNAKRLKVSSRMSFLKKDLNEKHIKLPKNFSQPDFIVGNPPYIDPKDSHVDFSVKKYEPQIALFSEDKGLKHIKSWLKLSSRILKDSFCIFEIGEEQKKDIKKYLKEENLFKSFLFLKDLNHKNRFVIGIK